MCQKIFVNRGEVEIETPAGFEVYFGFAAKAEEGYEEILPECCLCQIDIEATLKEKDIPFKTDGFDYYVGDIEF